MMGGSAANRPQLTRFATTVASSAKPYRSPSLTNGKTYDPLQKPLWVQPSRWFRANPRDYLRAANKSAQTRISSLFQRKPLINHSALDGFSTSTSARSSDVGRYTGSRTVTRFVRRLLKWTPFPIVFGLIFLAYRKLSDFRLPTDGVSQHFHRGETSVKVGDTHGPKRLPWHIPTVFYVYQFLPLRALSRSWGWLNDLYLPHWLRRPVLNTYIRLFNCNLSEANIQDLKWYKNLGEFFRRHLKPGVRPVAVGSSVVSPSDGIVLHVGRVEDDCVEQVKGMTYSLAGFLGPKNWFDHTSDLEPVVEEDMVPEPSHAYRTSLSIKKSGTDLYHCVIYLAPGDYHRFHSPADWNIQFRRHFPGHLFSVSPSVTRRIEGLFNYNERVVYYGNWEHGFFSMAAVGATNVGSIRVHFDERLKTNNKRYKRGAYQDWNFAQHKAPSDVKGIGLGKGDDFGEFHLGSTIVLLFEAPKGFKFDVEVGEHVQYGRGLGRLPGEH